MTINGLLLKMILTDSKKILKLVIKAVALDGQGLYFTGKYTSVSS